MELLEIIEVLVEEPHHSDHTALELVVKVVVMVGKIMEFMVMEALALVVI